MIGIHRAEELSSRPRGRNGPLTTALMRLGTARTSTAPPRFAGVRRTASQQESPRATELCNPIPGAVQGRYSWVSQVSVRSAPPTALSWCEKFGHRIVGILRKAYGQPKLRHAGEIADARSERLVVGLLRHSRRRFHEESL